jgi:hypothetical protein
LSVARAAASVHGRRVIAGLLGKYGAETVLICLVFLGGNASLVEPSLTQPGDGFFVPELIGTCGKLFTTFGAPSA